MGDPEDEELTALATPSFSPPAAKRQRADNGHAQSSRQALSAPPDDFAHCLIYNVSLTDMLVSTRRVASTVSGSQSAEEARRRVCTSLGRPKFSNQVRSTTCRLCYGVPGGAQRSFRENLRVAP